MTEYDAVLRVIEERIEMFDWEIKQLKDERRDIRDDPEMGYDCSDYKEVVTELRYARAQRAALWDLCDGLEDRVRDLLQADAMGQL